MAMRKNYKRLLIIATPVIFFTCFAGCTPVGTIEEDDENSRIPELTALRQKTNRLEKENIILTDQISILKESNEGLSTRSKKLEDRCNQLQLEVERRTEQVELLQDLPAQRDKFKAELKKQKARAEKLERELKKYRD